MNQKKNKEHNVYVTLGVDNSRNNNNSSNSETVFFPIFTQIYTYLGLSSR